MPIRFPRARALTVLSSLTVLAVPAAAQAPRITAAGDPSVASDSIYRGANELKGVDDAPFVYLLDDGVARYEADGRGTRTYRQVIYIIKPEAVADWAEQQFSYSPSHEKLTVNWTKVLRPDGTVLADQAAVTQDADIPAAAENPVYQDTKVRRLSLPKVAPGTIVDFSYTMEELKPMRPGDFYLQWSVHTRQPVRHSRYIVDLPASFKPAIIEKNLPGVRKEQVTKDRRVMTWYATNVPRIEVEPFASDSNGVLQTIEITGGGAWSSVGSWYAQLAKGRATPTAKLGAVVDSLVKGAKTREDSLRAVHRWVAQDIRYVSVSLGIGGYQPRQPDTVVSTGFGDCKDKATLFVASMAHLGIKAYPVLVSSRGGVDRKLPTIRQFDHMIAALPRPEGNLYVDLTAELVPLGSIPFQLQGEFGLLVKPDGSVDEVTLPQDKLEANVATRRFSGELSADGHIAGRLSQEFQGVTQYPVRAALSSKPDSTQRARMASSIAGGLFPGAAGDSLTLFDGKNLQADPRIGLYLSGGQAARVSGNSAVLTLPGGNNTPLLNLANSLTQRGPRTFPIDASAVTGTLGDVTSLQVTLPAGWHARLPAPVSAVSRFGRYEATYAQEGRQLRVERRFFGARGTLPPDSVTELITWLKAVAADDAPFVVVDITGT